MILVGFAVISAETHRHSTARLAWVNTTTGAAGSITSWTFAPLQELLAQPDPATPRPHR